MRLELFTPKVFEGNLLNTGKYTLEEYNLSIQSNIPQRKRKLRVLGVDFAKLPNSSVTGGQNADKLIRDNLDENSLEKQSEFPHLKFSEDNPIIIDLGETRLINLITINLFDSISEDSKGKHSFGYYIETSVEKEGNYFRVIDHSDFICRSKQKIYFYPREVRYVKIVGRASYLDLELDPSNDYLFLRSFSCQLTDEIFDITRGIWAPRERVTDYAKGCFLAYGENEPERHIPWMLSPHCLEGNHSFHKKHPKKYLLIQLTQPIFINRIRMNLMENDYSFKIESLNTHLELKTREYKLLMDENNYNNQEFEYLLVSFLKIKGTSTNHQFFRCSDFCCPLIQN